MIRRRHFFAINTDRADQMPGLRQKHLWIYRPTKTKKEWKGRILPTEYLLPLHFRTGPQRSYLFSGKQVLQRHKAGEHLHRNLVKIFIRHIDHTLYHKNILCVFRATVLYWIMRCLCLLQEENMIRSIRHIWEFMIDYCRIRKENTMSYGKHRRSITIGLVDPLKEYVETIQFVQDRINCNYTPKPSQPIRRFDTADKV